MKKQNKETLKKDPILTVSKKEAEKQLDERIIEGRNIKEKKISNESELSESDSNYKEWSKKNYDLLMNIFNSDIIANEYQDAKGILTMASETSEENRFPVFSNNFYNTIGAKIDLLQSIKGKINSFAVAFSPGEEEKPVPFYDVKKENTVFISHGKDKLCKRLKEFLEGELKIKTVSYDFKSIKSESIPQSFEKLLSAATFAILILADEDDSKDEKFRILQNIIYETGLMQGKLGFDKVIILRQEGMEETNILTGVKYIKFSGDIIEQTFYELNRVLKSEGMIN